MIEPLILPGDCLPILREIDDDSIDVIITDPPYGLSNTDPAHVVEAITQWVSGNREFVPHKKGGFMGKEWDSFVPPPAVWDECLRILKPGGHVLTFAGTRTMDLMTLGLRLAGFDIRDSLAWLYGSGFPKSLDVSKAIDKAAGAEREVIGSKLDRPGYHLSEPGKEHGVLGMGHGLHVDPEARAKAAQITAAATDAAREWEGWGTALKPAFEPIIMARKPFKGTVVANVLEHGMGALNIDATRIGQPDGFGGGRKGSSGFVDGYEADGFVASTQGRWPANVVLGHTEDCEPTGTRKVKSQNPKYRRRQEDEVQDGRSSYVTPKRPENVGIGHADADGTETVEAWNCAPGCQVAELDAQSGTLAAGNHPARRGGDRGDSVYALGHSGTQGSRRPTDTGGASRFFYCAKAPKKERPVVVGEDGTRTVHPTEPLALMRWLIRLVTPPGGIILDPFVGSGTTIEAGMLEGFEVWGIEGEDEYLPLIQQRVDRVIGGAS